MSKKTLILLVVLVAIILIVFLVLGPKDKKLAVPGLVNEAKVTETEPSSVPPVAPRTFQYDRSTDLRQELEQVNPKVLDSDFE